MILSFLPFLACLNNFRYFLINNFDECDAYNNFYLYFNFRPQDDYEFSRRLHLAPLTDEEIFSTGLRIKKELSENIVKETHREVKQEPWLEIKKESLNFVDGVKDEVSEVKVKHELPFFKDLLDFRHEANEKDLSGAQQKGIK